MELALAWSYIRIDQGSFYPPLRVAEAEPVKGQELTWGMTKPDLAICCCTCSGMTGAGGSACRLFTRCAIGSPNLVRSLSWLSKSSLRNVQCLWSACHQKCCPASAKEAQQKTSVIRANEGMEQAKMRWIAEQDVWGAPCQFRGLCHSPKTH